MLTTVITGAIVAGFAATVAIVLVVQARRIRMQRVVLDHGMLSVSDPVTGRLDGLPVESIGTVVYLPERNRTRPGEATAGVWTWGGILVLDATGKLARRIVHVPGSDFSLATFFDQIPAAEHVRIDAKGTGPYSRSDFVKQFPRALGSLELRGATWWSLIVVGLVFVALPIALMLGTFIASLLTALLT